MALLLPRKRSRTCLQGTLEKLFNAVIYAQSIRAGVWELDVSLLHESPNGAISQVCICRVLP